MKSTTKQSTWIIKLALSLALSFIVLLFTQEWFFTIGPLKALELKHIDERLLNRGAIDLQDTADVIILEVTQNTIDGIPNAYPFPRNVYAKVIENLTQAGVKAVGIDIVMSTPDREIPENDSALFQVSRKYKNVVFGGKIIHREGSISQGDGSGQSFQITSQKENYESVFFEADSSVGIVNVISDNDGVVRRYLPFQYASSTDKLIPTFSFAVLNKYFGLPSQNISKITPSEFILAGKAIPKYDNTSMLINFYGPSRTFKYVDLLNVVDDHEFKTNDEIDFEMDVNLWSDSTVNDLTGKPNGFKYSGMFKDKIVLIGSTMPEDKDIIPISFARGEKSGDNMIYGVEVHANAIQNVIDSRFLVKEPWWADIIKVVLLTTLCFFLSSLLKGIKTKFGLLIEALNLLIILVFVLIIRYTSFFLFDHFNFVIAYLSPVFAVVFGYIGSTAYHFISERRQKGVIKGMFSQYVSGAVVDDLINNPDKLSLGGEKKVLTVFFSDIAGFSTFSEKKEPEDLVKFLNEYLSAMTEIVFQNFGTLDKYIGDAVMAFWGAPTPNEKHAFLACKAALDMQVRIKALKENWRKEGEPEINARMGINTGDMVVGNVGGTQRFDYTVMGDNVNLASRLEGANKEYGTYIMLSETTHELVKDLFTTRELDFLVVKGRTKPMKVYELLGHASEPLPENVQKGLDIYNQGLHLYRSQKFQEAIDTFKKVNEVNPDDSVAPTYVKRCHYFMDNPPSADWDGVFIMKTK